MKYTTESCCSFRGHSVSEKLKIQTFTSSMCRTFITTFRLLSRPPPFAVAPCPLACDAWAANTHSRLTLLPPSLSLTPSSSTTTTANNTYIRNTSQSPCTRAKPESILIKLDFFATSNQLFSQHRALAFVPQSGWHELT